jgi:hypothetical protein
MARARKLQKGKGTVPPKKRRLTEFRGMFPATKPFIGVEATRQHVAQDLGDELDRKIRKR